MRNIIEYLKASGEKPIAKILFDVCDGESIKMSDAFELGLSLQGILYLERNHGGTNLLESELEETIDFVRDYLKFIK